MKEIIKLLKQPIPFLFKVFLFICIIIAYHMSFAIGFQQGSEIGRNISECVEFIKLQNNMVELNTINYSK